MRISVLPPPTDREIRSRRVHELLRDFPELVHPLESRGIHLGETGGMTLSQLLPADGSWLPELMAAMRWRVKREP